jgi:hypothetical protein
MHQIITELILSALVDMNCINKLSGYVEFEGVRKNDVMFVFIWSYGHLADIQTGYLRKIR